MGTMLVRTVAVIVALCLTSPGLARQPKKPAKENSDRPGVRLRADVQAGFAPLTVHFTGRLRNVPADANSFCHAGTFLMRMLSDDDFQILSGEDPACIHSPDTVDVPLTFSFTYVVEYQGQFEFVAMVKTQDGGRIMSNAIPVRVLSSPAGSGR